MGPSTFISLYQHDAFQPLLISQRVDGIEIGGLHGRQQAEDDADDHGKGHGDNNGRDTDHGDRTVQGSDKLSQDQAQYDAQDTAHTGEHGGFRQKLP